MASKLRSFSHKCSSKISSLGKVHSLISMQLAMETSVRMAGLYVVFKCLSRRWQDFRVMATRIPSQQRQGFRHNDVKKVLHCILHSSYMTQASIHHISPMLFKIVIATQQVATRKIWLLGKPR